MENNIRNAKAGMSHRERNQVSRTMKSFSEAAAAISERFQLAVTTAEVGSIVRELSVFSAAAMELAKAIAKLESDGNVRNGMTKAEAEYAACGCGECEKAVIKEEGAASKEKRARDASQN